MTEPTNDTSLTPLAAIRCGNTECERHNKEARTMCAVGKSWAELCTDYRPADHIVDANKMVKCGNTECENFDRMFFKGCRVHGSTGVAACEGYSPAERDAAAGKPTIVSPYTSTELAEFATIRTERDQARAELAIARDERDMEAVGRDRAHNALRIALGELGDLRRAMELTGHVLPEIDEAQYEYSPKGEDREGAWPEVWSGSTWIHNLPAPHADCILLTRRRRRVRRAPTDADAVEVPRRPCWVRNNADEDWIPATLLAVDETRHPKGPKFLIRRTDGRTLRFNGCEIEVEA